MGRRLHALTWICLTALGCANPELSADHPLELFRNNHPLGPGDGCITTFTAEQAQERSLTATCGMSADSVSTVAWTCRGPAGGGFEFVFEYHPGANTETPATRHRSVVFRGAPVVVFEDERSRTTLRLAPPGG